MTASAALDHIIMSVLPPSAAMADDARTRGGDLAGWLAGARHAPRPSAERRIVLVIGADHGVLDPGVALGPDHPTIVALAALDGGEAALCRIARTAGATLLLVDAGVAEPAHLPRAVLGVSPGHGSGDLATGAALSIVDVGMALDAGVALATALAEDGVDVLALGAVGRARVAAGLALVPPAASPAAVLAAVGGRDIAVLAGVILAAAAMHVAVIVDGAVTTAAALVAARLAPNAAGYVCAAHAGGGAAAAAARRALGLTPLVAAGLGHGEGAGAAMALPLVAAAAAAIG